MFLQILSLVSIEITFVGSTYFHGAQSTKYPATTASVYIVYPCLLSGEISTTLHAGPVDWKTSSRIEEKP